MADKLLDSLNHLQEINKLSDRQLALRLGIDPGHYSKIKRGLIPPGMKFLNALAREFPEMKLAVYEYIAGKPEKENETVNGQ